MTGCATSPFLQGGEDVNTSAHIAVGRCRPTAACMAVIWAKREVLAEIRPSIERFMAAVESYNCAPRQGATAPPAGRKRSGAAGRLGAGWGRYGNPRWRCRLSGAGKSLTLKVGDVMIPPFFTIAGADPMAGPGS